MSGLVDLMESATVNLGRVRAPTMLMYGAHDQVVETGPMRARPDPGRAPPNLRTAYYPDGWHLLDRDLEAETCYRDVEAWIRRDPDASSAVGRRAGVAQLRP